MPFAVLLDFDFSLWIVPLVIPALPMLVVRYLAREHLPSELPNGATLEASKSLQIPPSDPIPGVGLLCNLMIHQGGLHMPSVQILLLDISS